MTRIVSRAESFDKIYEAFQNINFDAFDYNTIKQSLIDYIKLNFPESYNDYIETSELIPILELFAYMGEILIYRIDMNSQENFLNIAQRKQSVLRLAKFISYKATRNIPARGLVKLTSISTTETVFDSSNVNIAGDVVVWNDPNNVKWKEHFFLIINKILEQPFGTVNPNERIQLNDILFETYQLTNNSTQLVNGTIPYSVDLSTTNAPMELVPTILDNIGPIERRPELNRSFSVIYGNDGLGDSSDFTGFFILTKQGTLRRTDLIYDGKTPNITSDISITDINDTDVWVNNVDPNSLEVVSATATEESGLWQQIDVSTGENIIFNTNSVRNKYEVETLENDSIRLIFGDDEFSNIPTGSFHIWTRTSLNQNVIIPKPSISNENASLTYSDIDQKIQTITFTFSLTSNLQNASISEDIEHIRRIAPTTYYTQNRMVNAQDYNSFLLQDPSILKLKAINRVFAGETKYINWEDPSEAYQNVKLFGDDLAIFYTEDTTQFTASDISELELINDFIEPLLSQPDIFLAISRLDPNNPARFFETTNKTDIVTALTLVSVNDFLHLNHTGITPRWTTSASATNRTIFSIQKTTNTSWSVTYKIIRMVIQSDDTSFWHTNQGTDVIDYESLNSVGDQISILRANENRNKDGLLDNNLLFNIIGHEIGNGTNAGVGIPDISKLRVLPFDYNQDALPDDVNLFNMIDRQTTYSIITDGTHPVTLPEKFIKGYSHFDVALDVVVSSGTGTLSNIVEEPAANVGDIIDTIEFDITGSSVNTTVTITMRDYVYFYREDSTQPWKIISENDTVLLNFQTDILPTALLDGGVGEGNNYKRNRGRSGYNFLWTHFSTRYNLIDPSTTNIIDMFIITRGYYTEVKNWLDDDAISSTPTPPTAAQLRSDYSKLLNNKMISDTVILHSGKIKPVFGNRADPSLQARLKIIKFPTTTLTENQIKNRVVTIVRNFFNINNWEFGETFYFTELAAAIHNGMVGDISSVVLTPVQPVHSFGDLFQVFVREDELIQVSISINDIDIVDAYNSINLKQ